MLLKSRISTIEIGSEDWFQARKARFTSSENHLLMGETKAAVNYIYRKVGEEITGCPIRKEIETEATTHGNTYEPKAIFEYAARHGLLQNIKELKYPYLVTQKLVYGENDRFCGTPDFIIVEAEDTKNQNSVTVVTGEVKCPFTYEAFISLSLCDSPLDLKKTKKEYYYQVIDQMLVCGSLRGVFVVYHPDFKSASSKEIYFNAMKDIFVRNDMAALQKRKDDAVIQFETIKNKITKNG